MKYYEARIIRPMFHGNVIQGQTTIVYFGLENKLTEKMLERFNWAIRSVHLIPSWEFAWHVLTKPVVNHDDCFNFYKSVVIE